MSEVNKLEIQVPEHLQGGIWSNMVPCLTLSTSSHWTSSASTSASHLLMTGCRPYLSRELMSHLS